jgi:hypothetical protein
MMRTYRVVLYDLPALAADLVRCAFSETEDMRVVAEVGERTLEQVVREAGADCVVAAVGDGQPPHFGLNLFAEFPGLRLIGLRADGRSASVFTLQCTILIGVAAQDLPDAIRNAGTLSSLPAPVEELPDDIPPRPKVVVT